MDDWQKWRLKDVKIFLLKEFNSAHQTLLSITLPLTGLADQSCLHLLDIKICSWWHHAQWWSNQQKMCTCLQIKLDSIRAMFVFHFLNEKQIVVRCQQQQEVQRLSCMQVKFAHILCAFTFVYSCVSWQRQVIVFKRRCKQYFWEYAAAIMKSTSISS